MRINKYGKAAIRATELVHSGKIPSPIEAWEEATCELFEKGKSGQVKGCPKDAFLGLCQEGKVKGINSGQYTSSEKNMRYALKGLELLFSNFAHNGISSRLWKKVMESEGKRLSHNGQMDVVLALWYERLILTSPR